MKFGSKMPSKADLARDLKVARDGGDRRWREAVSGKKKGWGDVARKKSAEARKKK